MLASTSLAEHAPQSDLRKAVTGLADRYAARPGARRERGRVRLGR
jgi:hypothetical protein